MLERARPGFAKDVVIVDHTTTSASGTTTRAARWKERGVAFVHAPVFMGPQNALDSTGIMLVSGDAARVESLTPALSAMTGKLHYLGERPDAAASFKLLGNLFLAKALDVSPAEASKLFDMFNPGATVGARMKRMTDAKFEDASWELSMARKDARIMMEEAARKQVPLAVLPAIAARMDAVIAEGHGSDDWTVLAKDALR